MERGAGRVWKDNREANRDHEGAKVSKWKASLQTSQE